MSNSLRPHEPQHARPPCTSPTPGVHPKKTYRQINTWKDAQHCLLLEKCQSKLWWDITSHQLECPSFKKSINSKCWRRCGERGTLLLCRWECKLIQPLWRIIWRFLQKLEIKLSYDPIIPLLGIYPEEMLSLRSHSYSGAEPGLEPSSTRTHTGAVSIIQHLLLCNRAEENFLLNLLDYNDQTFKITCILVG